MWIGVGYNHASFRRFVDDFSFSVVAAIIFGVVYETAHGESTLNRLEGLFALSALVSAHVVPSESFHYLSQDLELDKS